MLKVHESAFDMVDVKRTAHATRLPSRSEHEMLYQQLATALEEIGQRLRAARALEDVVLLDANPGQCTSPEKTDTEFQCCLVFDYGIRGTLSCCSALCSVTRSPMSITRLYSVS